MNYNHYSEEDFIKDEHFQKWVLTPDLETKSFWENWINEHPNKKIVIENAVRFIKLIEFGEEELKMDDLKVMWQNINRKKKNTAIDIKITKNR